MNVAFQANTGDISRVYADLREFIFSLARRIVRPEALRMGQPGMLRLTELNALKESLQQNRFKPLSLINYGEGFWQLVAELKLSDEVLKDVQMQCADFLVKYISELCDRMPSCIDAVEKMRAFTPSAVLKERGRPEFRDLPLDLLQAPWVDKEAMENQWLRLGTLNIKDICPEATDVSQVDIIFFWKSVWDLKNAAGERVFGDIAKFVLNCMCLPLSNAVAERLFSVLAIIKNKLRNKLGFAMLDSLLRVRVHLHANKLCCSTFKPTEAMIELFNSKIMYPNTERQRREASDEDESNVDDPEVGYDEAAAAAQPATVHFDDADVPVALAPGWEDMLNLMEEVDALDV